MSTTLKTFKSDVSKYELEVYKGTGGLCFFIKQTDGYGMKFWINENDLDELEEAIRIYRRGT